MQTREMELEDIVPRISLCRLFDTAHAPENRPPNRISEFYELGFYLEGDGAIRIGDECYPVHRGDIRFTRPGTYLCSEPHYRCYTIYFDFGKEDTVYKNPILDGIPEFFHGGEELQPRFAELVRQYSAKDLITPLRQKAMLLDLLTQILEMIYSRKAYCAAVKTCMDYMEKHYAEHITLETLGQLTGYSGLHLLRLFKQDTGGTAHDYLTLVRISRAKELLPDVSRSLGEIAAACGFRSEPHFKELFKKKTGLTPGKYRKNTMLI